MKRATFLAVLFLAGQVVWAQQEEQNKPAAPNPPESSQNSARQTNNSNQAQMPETAPKLGHPLDPADVDILTGKADRNARGYSPGFVPYMYGYGAAGYGGRYAAGSTKTSPPFVPLAFGNVNGRSFVVIGSTFRGAPPLFIPPRGFGSFFFFRR
jgi:hypothetical protein